MRGVELYITVLIKMDLLQTEKTLIKNVLSFGK